MRVAIEAYLTRFNQPGICTKDMRYCCLVVNFLLLRRCPDLRGSITYMKCIGAIMPCPDHDQLLHPLALHPLAKAAYIMKESYIGPSRCATTKSWLAGKFES